MVAPRSCVAALVLVLVPAVLSGLGGCSVGEVPIGGTGVDGGTDGAQSFNAIVKPLVGRCAVVGCHAGTQVPNLSDYSKLDARYKMKPGSTNILVTKGSLTGGMHSAMPYLSSAEQAKVAMWIDSL
jgi:hypothetical protein